MSFHVWQRVICINSEPLPCVSWWDDDDPPLLGEVYTVRRCFTDDEGDLILWLNEIRRGPSARFMWGDDVGYGAYRFRPVVERKTNISIFTAMLTPSPTKREPVA